MIPVQRPLLAAALLCACAPAATRTRLRPAGGVADPCGESSGGGTGAQPGTPDAGAVPTGSVGKGGGTVDRLWFATTGDTRPSSCNDTAGYPKAAIAQIAAAMKALRVQFTVDLGDHMFVCSDQAGLRPAELDLAAQAPLGAHMGSVPPGA